MDPTNKAILCESGKSISYDVVSFNCGSYVPKPEIIGDKTDFFTVKPIEKLLDAQKRILSLVSEKKAVIGIVGGGPSAIEVAGNIWGLTANEGKNKPVIRIFTRGRLMGHFSDSIRKKVVRSLSSRGIDIQEKSPITQIKADRIGSVIYFV